MSDFTSRIDNILNERKMKRSDLYKTLDIPQTSFSSWIKGSIPNAEIALKISRFLNVSLEYLITGEGEKPKSDLIFLSEEENELIDIYRSLDKRGRVTLLNIAKALEVSN